jgi:hypothetical protein
MLQEIIEELKQHNPFPDVSKNTPDATIITVGFSKFAELCDLDIIKMAQFKRTVFQQLPEIMAIVGQENIVIRLRANPEYLEVYDLMIINVSDDQVQQVRAEVPVDYIMRVVTIKWPVADNKPDMKTIMFSYASELNKSGYVV